MSVERCSIQLYALVPCIARSKTVLTAQAGQLALSVRHATIVEETETEIDFSACVVFSAVCDSHAGLVAREMCTWLFCSQYVARCDLQTHSLKERDIQKFAQNEWRLKAKMKRETVRCVCVCDIPVHSRPLTFLHDFLINVHNPMKRCICY